MSPFFNFKFSFYANNSHQKFFNQQNFMHKSTQTSVLIFSNWYHIGTKTALMTHGLLWYHQFSMQKKTPVILITKGLQALCFHGATGGIRTPDPRLRSKKRIYALILKISAFRNFFPYFLLSHIFFIYQGFCASFLSNWYQIGTKFYA